MFDRPYRLFAAPYNKPKSGFDQRPMFNCEIRESKKQSARILVEPGRSSFNELELVWFRPTGFSWESARWKPG
jgi:hypothetical protein